MFYTALKHTHNSLGILLLFVLLFVILFLLARYAMKKPFDKAAKTASLVGLITAHLQILIGIVLYLVSPVGFSSFSGEAMKETVTRFYLVEHPTGMIIAVILITLGYRAAKSSKLNDNSKYARVLAFYTIGYLIVAYLVPWFLWFK